MKKHIFVLLIAAGACAAAGCTSTFMVVKNGKGFHLGSGSATAYKVLCETGDLKLVLSDTGLPQQTRDDIYRFNCLERSREKIKAIYAGLAPAERKDLRQSFQRHGYEINAMLC